MQQLRESYRSVKTKRLFMYAAEQLKRPWLNSSDLSRLDFGFGKRSMDPDVRLQGSSQNPFLLNATGFRCMELLTRQLTSRGQGAVRYAAG